MTYQYNYQKKARKNPEILAERIVSILGTYSVLRAGYSCTSISYLVRIVLVFVTWAVCIAVSTMF